MSELIRMSLPRVIGFSLLVPQMANKCIAASSSSRRVGMQEEGVCPQLEQKVGIGI
jgi:hypothetical protein